MEAARFLPSSAGAQADLSQNFINLSFTMIAQILLNNCWIQRQIQCQTLCCWEISAREFSVVAASFAKDLIGRYVYLRFINL